MSQQGVWLYRVIQGPMLIEALPFIAVHLESMASSVWKRKIPASTFYCPGLEEKHYLPHNLLAKATHIAQAIQRGWDMQAVTCIFSGHDCLCQIVC